MPEVERCQPLSSDLTDEEIQAIITEQKEVGASSCEVRIKPDGSKELCCIFPEIG